MKGWAVRRAGLAMAVAAALTGTAACTSSGSSGEGRHPTHEASPHAGSLAALRSAARSTDRADSARVESTTTMGTLMSMTADGTLAWDDGITGTLTIRYTGGTVADTMRRLGTTSMEARYLPDAYYARMGDKFAEQTGGKHWIRYAYDDLEALAGGSGALLRDQMRNTTPNQSVKLLLASGDVRKAGEETVRGERTTRYTGTVHVADVTDAALKKQLTEAGVTTETVDIWVNDEDLLVKKVEKARMATGQMTQTAYYDDYGVKVPAEKPPAGDTQDFRELLQKQGGAS
ncbi:lipoprotein [Streptomyces deserti]